MAETEKIKLAVLAMHPVQYHTPLYQEMARKPELCVKVIYLDKVGIEGRYDHEFRSMVEWDIPLLDHYDYEFLKNHALNNHRGFFSRINLGLPFSLKKGRFDAILIQGYSLASCWIALFAARLLGVKVIWRGEVILKKDDESNAVRSRLRRMLIEAFLKRCDAFLYTCSGNRDFLSRYAPRSKPLHPFVCAVDNEYFRTQLREKLPKGASVRSELGIPEENVVVVFCGRLTSWKRPLDLVRAIHIAGAKGMTALIIGDGPLREELLAIASRFGVHLVHVGFVNQSEISRYYAIADVFCLPSARDNSPKALNEAMNFDLVPIVSNVVGTCRDLIVEGKTGFSYRPGDVETLAAHLVRLRTDPELRRAMAKGARAHVASFTYKANVDGLAAAARDALAISASDKGASHVI